MQCWSVHLSVRSSDHDSVVLIAGLQIRYLFHRYVCILTSNMDQRPIVKLQLKMK